MKKIVSHLLPAIFLLIGSSITLGQTASDFTANDCGGTSHHLFSELDSGFVVVISFVMPCGTCIGPTQSAFTAVQDYAGTHPGKVRFYLADDFGNTPCGTLTSWANNNGMGGVTTLSHQEVTETPYGSGGMPKIVVLGGWDHKVHFVQNGGLNTTNFKNAINTALTLSSVPESETKTDFQLKVFPNPAIDDISVHYVLSRSAPVNVEIYNMVGVLVKEHSLPIQEPGEQIAGIGIADLSDGVYLVKMKGAEFSQTCKFVVAR